MQSIRTILLFEVMYRHRVLGIPLDEVENQLKNYPTQDAQDLLKRLRMDIAVDTLNRPPENEDDVSVTEAKHQEQGGREEYRAHFNKMLQKYGASNISDLNKDQRKEFFNKIDKHWKAKDEMKEGDEILIDEMLDDFAEFFMEFADIFALIKKEMDREVLEEASKTKRTTQTRITRQTKIDRAVGALSVQYAKAVNDPMYKKFKKFKDKWMKYKERIQAKYKARVRTAARQGGGIAHLLKGKQKSGSETGKTKKKKK